MSTVAVVPPGPDIEYPEGRKVVQGDLHWTRQSELVHALRTWLARRPAHEGAWAFGDMNVYYRRGDPATVVAPDVAVAFGVDLEKAVGKNTYLMWEAGAPPTFVLEIASPTTVAADVRDKPAKYADLGVEEYWRFDPTGGELLDPPLQAESRRGGRWEPMAVVPGGPRSGVLLWGRSDVLGLDLCWDPPKLRLYDPATETWLLDHEGEAARADREAARADAAIAAARAAEAELAALRRSLGHPPTPAMPGDASR